MTLRATSGLPTKSTPYNSPVCYPPRNIWSTLHPHPQLSWNDMWVTTDPSSGHPWGGSHSVQSLLWQPQYCGKYFSLGYRQQSQMCNIHFILGLANHRKLFPQKINLLYMNWAKLDNLFRLKHGNADLIGASKCAHIWVRKSPILHLVT